MRSFLLSLVLLAAGTSAHAGTLTVIQNSPQGEMVSMI